ncbi:hypothetical protein Tco_0041249, partial [Tanacetum coccineum]
EPDIVDVKDGILEQQANADKGKTTVIQETVWVKVEEQMLIKKDKDISGQPRIRLINHIMTHDPFVENLSRPDGCKSDKVTVPEYMSAFINNKDLLEYRFP